MPLPKRNVRTDKFTSSPTALEISSQGYTKTSSCSHMDPHLWNTAFYTYYTITLVLEKEQVWLKNSCSGSLGEGIWVSIATSIWTYAQSHSEWSSFQNATTSLWLHRRGIVTIKNKNKIKRETTNLYTQMFTVIHHPEKQVSIISSKPHSLSCSSITSFYTCAWLPQWLSHVWKRTFCWVSVYFIINHHCSCTSSSICFQKVNCQGRGTCFLSSLLSSFSPTPLLFSVTGFAESQAWPATAEVWPSYGKHRL